MKKTIFLLTMLCLLAGMLPVLASETQAGEQITITQAVNHNLYVAAGKMTIKAPVNGDVIAAGGRLSLMEFVAADVAVFGGEIFIHNKVAGDVRIAGGSVRISGQIQGDLIMMGGELIVEPSASIQGDVKILGGEIKFSGTANGNVQIYGGEVEFAGEAAHDMEIKAGEIAFNGAVRGVSILAAKELEMGASARFYDDVEYWSESGEMNIDPYLEEGATAKYNENLKFQTNIDKNVIKNGMKAFAIFSLVSSSLLIVLLVSFFAPFFAKHAGMVKDNVGNYLSMGTAFFFVTPIVGILACMTLIGIPIGFIMFSGYAIVLTLASSLTSVVAAYELEKYLNRNWSKGVIMAVAIAAFIVLKVVGMIAFPGKLIVFILTAVAIGSVIQWLRQGWRKPDDTPESNEAAAQDDSETV